MSKPIKVGEASSIEALDEAYQAIDLHKKNFKNVAEI